MTTTILIAEDDDNLWRLLLKAFRQTEFSVVEARDGYEAMQHLENFIPDLVVLDHNMPGPSGLQILKKIRQCAGGSRVIVIVMTGDHLAEQSPEAVLADLFLLKPVSMRDLITLAKRYLGSAAKTEPRSQEIHEAIKQARPDLFDK